MPILVFPFRHKCCGEILLGDTSHSHTYKKTHKTIAQQIVSRVFFLFHFNIRYICKKEDEVLYSSWQTHNFIHMYNFIRHQYKTYILYDAPHKYSFHFPSPPDTRLIFSVGFVTQMRRRRRGRHRFLVHALFQFCAGGAVNLSLLPFFFVSH